MTDMKQKLRADAEKIYTGAIKACLPDSAVEDAMKKFNLPKGRLILVAIGKAAWKMARRAHGIVTEELCGTVDCGAVITKYGHYEGNIGDLEIYEAAHPVPDINGVMATERVLALTENLTADDLVLFLISGGGSALFESPFCPLDELSSITKQLLASGADINEINAVRKHISKVKGGRFAEEKNVLAGKYVNIENKMGIASLDALTLKAPKRRQIDIIIGETQDSNREGYGTLYCNDIVAGYADEAKWFNPGDEVYRCAFAVNIGTKAETEKMAKTMKPYVTDNNDLYGASVVGADGAEYLLILNIGEESISPRLPAGFEIFSGEAELKSGAALLCVNRNS